MADPFEQLRPALADRYALERELGRGGMATVYLARELKHGRLVAIKVLRPEIAGALGPERFLREIELAARLTHPHILPLHDSGQVGGFLYYVMPYIEGESLRDRLEGEGQLSLEDALRITREVASALSYAHSHDVVHRDIKPENILLSGGEAVVADFGIARAITQAAGPRLTETGISVGTPEYMSPEQASGGASIDGRSDVYSLACVLYEMLSGEPPYTGPTAQVVITKRLTDPVPSVRRLRETTPPAVDAAITRALAKAPADRFTKASEFVRALDAAAGSTRSPVPFRAAMAAGLVFASVVAYGLWARFEGRPGAESDSQHKMLVVLPFENMGAAEDEYFADGLSEAITTRLGGIRGLGVIARQSAVAYRKTTKSPQLIGRELGVQYILGGTIRWEKSPRAPSRVRMSTALVRVSDANQLWAKQYDTVLAGVFGVESNLAEKVAGALDIALAEPERRALAREPTQDLEAHDLYLRGRFFFNQNTELSLRRSIELYQQALAKDRHFALALAGIADAWVWLADAFVAPRDAYPKAKVAALEALRIDSTLGDGLAALGATELFYDWNFAEAKHHLERAVASNPSASTAYIYYGALLGTMGQLDSAFASLTKAQSLDPLSSGAGIITGNWLLASRKYDEAIQQFRKTLRIDPHAETAHQQLGYALFFAGRSADALKEFGLLDSIPPDILARMGRPEAARRRLGKLIRERGRRYLDATSIASGYANLGDRDRAFAWLDSAYTDRSAWLIALRLDPSFDALHGDPRFQALTTKIGLPDNR